MARLCAAPEVPDLRFFGGVSRMLDAGPAGLLDAAFSGCLPAEVSKMLDAGPSGKLDAGPSVRVLDAESGMAGLSAVSRTCAA